MAFTDFKFPQVLATFSLRYREMDLYSGVPAEVVESGFEARIEHGRRLGVGSNEKGRSEFLIAPVLQQVHFLLDFSFGLHSGQAFDVDQSRGLNGFCDFLLSRSPTLRRIDAPILAVVEAKNDSISEGIGQCIGAMVAIQAFNAGANRHLETVHGLITTGMEWQFLQLCVDEVIWDVQEYQITQLGKLLSILRSILSPTPATASP